MRLCMTLSLSRQNSVYNMMQVVKAMKPLKEKISITIDQDVLEKARVEAEKDDRSLSQYINLILRDYLKKQEESVK